MVVFARASTFVGESFGTSFTILSPAKGLLSIGTPEHRMWRQDEGHSKWNYQCLDISSDIELTTWSTNINSCTEFSVSCAPRTYMRVGHETVGHERARSMYHLPVGHPRLVQSHEVDLTGRAALGRAEEDLVVALAQKLELLRLLVHEDAVEVAGLHRPDLDGLVAPSHDLPGANVRHGGRQLSPLQDNVFGNL